MVINIRTITHIAKNKHLRKKRVMTCKCDGCDRYFDLPYSKWKIQQGSHCCSPICWSANFRREKAPAWRGGRTRDGNGYIRIPVDRDYPNAYVNRNTFYVLEHRYVIQQALGRPLLQSETVHHRNGIRHDNRLGNLELRAGNHGTGSTSYTEDVNRLLSELEKLKQNQVNIKTYSLAEYASKGTR